MIQVYQLSFTMYHPPASQIYIEEFNLRLHVETMLPNILLPKQHN